MLHSAKKLQGMKIMAIDGEAGHVEDVYFDDQKWGIRHLQLDTGGWLTGRKVLISPISITQTDWDDERVYVNLSKQQIQDAPGIDADKPVSRQHEEDMYRHYGYPYYWSGPYLWGYTVLPAVFADQALESPERQHLGEELENQGNDVHLRSVDEVTGYHIHATDHTLGHIDDFLFDDEDWSIRLIVVDTRNWWFGKDVLIPPQRVNAISWGEKKVYVNATKQEIENSPQYDESSPPEAGRTDLYQTVLNRPPEWDVNKDRPYSR